MDKATIIRYLETARSSIFDGIAKEGAEASVAVGLLRLAATIVIEALRAGRSPDEIREELRGLGAAERLDLDEIAEDWAEGGE